MWKFLSVLGLAASVFGQDILGSMGCTSPVCVFSNKYLRFGSGAETSVNNWGLFVQPWYYSEVASAWYKLTFSSYPLDTAIGVGTGSSHWSGATISDLYSLTPTASSTDYSNFIVNASDTTKTVGFGKIVATRSFVVFGQLITLQNTFSLGQYDRFVRITNVIINNSTAPLQNTYFWVGTRDDYVGNTDVNTKTRGNLINGNFTAITANNQSSYAIMITNTNEGVLFYSETPGVMTAYALCCTFSNVYNVNPLSLLPATPSPTDGSYAAVLPLGTVAVNSSASITWYYAAGVISSLASVAQTVAIAQIADAGPVPTYTSVATYTSQLSVTPTTTLSLTPTGTQTPSSTISISPSGTPTSTQTPASTRTPSITPSVTSTATQSQTSTVSYSPTSTPTSTQSPSSTQTSTSTPTTSSTATQSSTQTPTQTLTPSSSASLLIHIVLVPVPQNNVTFIQTVTGLDSLMYIYTFVPINILLILCFCCMCGAGCYFYRRKKPAVEKVDVNTIHVREVEEGDVPAFMEKTSVLNK